MSAPPILGEFEHIVLLAILRLDDKAYGVAIRNEIKATTGREPTPGALYTTIDRLEDKSLLSSSFGDPTPQRGGRAKRYVKVTAQGMKAISHARQCYLRLWEGLPFPGAAHA